MAKKPFKVPKPPSKDTKIARPINENIKRLPSAIDLETAVLGAILIDKKGFSEVYNLLRPEMFYKNEHQIIYEHMTIVHEKGQPIDLLTLSEILKSKQKLNVIGGDFYLISLTQKVFSSAHIEHHARIIMQKYVLREMIKVGNYISSHAYYSDPDIFDIMEYNERFINKIKNVIKVDDVTHRTPEDELKEKMNNYMQGNVSGIKTYISEFDDWCGGLQNRELIILAARPGMGKTTLIIVLSYKMSHWLNIGVTFISMEMSYADIMNRYASIETGISFSKIKDGKITARQYTEILESYKRIREKPLAIHFGEKNHYSIMEKIKKDVRDNGTKIVFIDYAQLIQISGTAGDETSELRLITRDLKNLAIKLNIPIVLLSQLKRDVDNRQNKRPLLSDLKQSGSLEEDADTVGFLYRESYYKKDVNWTDKEFGRLEIDIAKGRNIGVNLFHCHLDVINLDLVSMSDYEKQN